MVKTYVNKCLSLSRLGENWLNKLIQNIVEAGRTISYIETLGNKADTFHLEIKQSDGKKFMHEFEREVRIAISKLRFKRVKIAFDTTEDLTWIKEGFNLRPSAYEHRLKCWNFLNVSIVEPYFFPLMSIPYRQIDNLDNLVIDLLKYVKSLPITVDMVLFDRGFYHAHLIDYLNGIKRGWAWPYLMLVSETKSVKRYIEEVREKGKSFGYFHHEFKYLKNKSSWKPSTTVIVKKVREDIYWCYATNMKPSLLLVLNYKKRWNIETGFRVHDEAMIKSKSRNLEIRFFYHLIGMLLIVLWRLQRLVKYYVFKRYLKFVEWVYYSDEVKLVLLPP
jgi:hypothetical protein